MGLRSITPRAPRSEGQVPSGALGASDTPCWCVSSEELAALLRLERLGGGVQGHITCRPNPLVVLIRDFYFLNLR